MSLTSLFGTPRGLLAQVWGFGLSRVIQIRNIALAITESCILSKSIKLTGFTGWSSKETTWRLTSPDGRHMKLELLFSRRISWTSCSSRQTH